MVRGLVSTVGLASTALLLLFLLPAVADTIPDRLSPDQAALLAGRGELTLIDVRTPVEWRQSGVPAGALQVDLVGAGDPARFVQAVLAAVKGDTARPIATICRTNNRARVARDLLRQAGFPSVSMVVEGVVPSGVGPGWIGRGLPVQQCTSC